MKYIINEFTDGTGFFSDDNMVLYEVVTEDYSEQYDVFDNKSDAKEIVSELNKENK